MSDDFARVSNVCVFLLLGMCRSVVMLFFCLFVLFVCFVCDLLLTYLK